ncbi:MAG: 2-oxoglutarate dehydrogenase E1 component [Planctomycetota bacterium]
MDAAPKPVSPSVNGWNAEYLDEQYRRFQQDPASLSPDVRAFFEGFELGMTRLGSSGGEGSDVSGGASHFQHQVDKLIEAYREVGHIAAKLDPFGREPERPPAIELGFHGLSESDLDREVDSSVGTTLRQVIERLETVYCGSIAIEYMHVEDSEEREWIKSRVETGSPTPTLERGLRIHLLEQLVQAELFETFLGKRYPGEKRFSLQGAETVIPLLNHVIECSANGGVEEIVLGMAHRGRLNVLNNVLGKTYEQIFTEFEDSWDEDFADGGGDVKYHRGYSATRMFASGKKVHLAMASNPSHLEAVDGVVLGRTRAKQRLRSDTERRRVAPLLIHGDAAIAGQGVVAETLNMSLLDGYTVGGCVHLVVNNLIGFTTAPNDGRSSRYCTDVAKMINAPVLHVNGEDPEAAMIAAEIAVEYRQKFGKDFFVDLYCYRRHGHNEQDEPSFTQPVQAKLIKGKPSILKSYAAKLRNQGLITDQDIEAIRARFAHALDEAQQAAKSKPKDPTIDPGSARWSGLSNGWTFEPGETAASKELVAEVCAALGTAPSDFGVNRKLQKLLTDRAALPETGDISYADAESIAYGTLLAEGYSVRLSGQDCRRGTFSHRHAVLRDAESGAPYIPLNNIREMGVPGTDDAPGTPASDGRPRQARFCVHDSPLSEAGVLGFEYGYSLADPGMLVLWEAQFGDFCNGAQVIIDQFVASAEAKWQRWSGLTLLLPHGYEGAGPEHSSARMERFLKLCGDDNMQIVYPTTAAQAFHMLRRQVKRSFRKPLIVFTPKSMLRTPTSKIDELYEGRFSEVLDDPNFVGRGQAAAKDNVKRVVVCCGKLYHELAGRRDEIGRKDVAIIRLEQVYPFHTEAIRAMLSSYPASAEIVWAQEEPMNMGAFHFVSHRFDTLLGLPRPRYIGRKASGSPATGSKSKHRQEQEAILAEAIGPAPAAGKIKADSKSDKGSAAPAKAAASA